MRITLHPDARFVPIPRSGPPVNQTFHHYHWNTAKSVGSAAHEAMSSGVCLRTKRRHFSGRAAPETTLRTNHAVRLLESAFWDSSSGLSGDAQNLAQIIATLQQHSQTGQRSKKGNIASAKYLIQREVGKGKSLLPTSPA